MDGQAESATESGGLNDLASFLSDTSETTPIDEEDAQNAEELTGEADTDETANSEQTDEEADDSQEEDAEKEAAPATKITFKVKGDDGTEETVEATPEELASSYMRQKDYTKKTQALAEREDQAVKFLSQKHEEIRNQYLSQAELSRAAVAQMAGIKSESEMAQLAHSDPAAWVSEQQRQQQIGNFLSQLDQQINGEKQRSDAEKAQSIQQQNKAQFEKTWAELQRVGIDKPKLAKIYGDVTQAYGYSDQELATVMDHRAVQIMADAVAYRSLKAQKADVTKKVTEAPRMPNRQAQPAQERREKAISDRFKGGRAKLNDLAAFLR